METDLRIEAIQPSHASAVQQLAVHPQIGATTNLPEPYPEGGALQWIRYLLPKRAAGREQAFAVIHEAEGLVGVCSLIDISRISGSAELGYWIGPPFWGRGYATQACRLVVEFGFDTLALRRLIARPLARNAASIRVLEKLQFRTLGNQPNPFPKFARSDLLSVYEMTRRRWYDQASSE